MSVAFRRESDEEHLEPKFELPLPPGANLVTPRGLALMTAKVVALNAALATTTGEAERKVIERDLRYWRARETTAVVAPVSAGDVVAFGSTVTFTLNGAPRTMTIVGSDQADPGAGLVTFTAPLARAMLGLAVGDVADFNGQADAVEIVAID